LKLPLDRQADGCSLDRVGKRHLNGKLLISAASRRRPRPTTARPTEELAEDIAEILESAHPVKIDAKSFRSLT
jgi:hypothetical protein